MCTVIAMHWISLFIKYYFAYFSRHTAHHNTFFIYVKLIQNLKPSLQTTVYCTWACPCSCLGMPNRACPSCAQPVGLCATSMGCFVASPSPAQAAQPRVGQIVDWATALAPPPPPPYPRPQPCKMRVWTFPRTTRAFSTIPLPRSKLIPSNSRRGLASLVMVACWTIHNLIGSIYLLFTPSPASTTTPYHATRNTTDQEGTQRSQTLRRGLLTAHSAHRWQQNRQKFLWDRLQIDARTALTWPYYRTVCKALYTR